MEYTFKDFRLLYIHYIHERHFKRLNQLSSASLSDSKNTLFLLNINKIEQEI